MQHTNIVFDDKKQVKKIMAFKLCDRLHTIDDGYDITESYDNDFCKIFNHRILKPKYKYSMFLKMNCAKYLSNITASDKYKEHYYKISQEVRNQIALYNMRLIAYALKYSRREDIDLAVAISEGSIKLFKTIDLYNINLLTSDNKPHKFSTYAVNALFRHFRKFDAELATKTHNCTPFESDHDLEESCVTYDDDYSEIDFKKTNFEIIKKSFSLLNDRELTIINSRFGIGGESKTLQELSSEFNVSMEMIRKIQLCAIRKIKRYCNVPSDKEHLMAD